VKKVVDFFDSIGVKLIILILINIYVFIDSIQFSTGSNWKVFIAWGIIAIYFIFIAVLKNCCYYYKWKKKMTDEKITITERMDILYNKILPEERKSMPNRIYKFIRLCDDKSENKKRFSTLENNQIWFSRVDNLNDPYEGCNCCYWDEFPDQEIDFFWGASNLRKQWNEYIQKRKLSLGICSFSKRHSLMPLWAHYANNHKGFCCEYEVIDKSKLFEVQYIACKFDVSKDINKLVKDYDENKITAEQYNAALYDIHKYTCIFKSLDWKDEQEIRSILYLEDNDTVGERTSIDSIGLKLKSIIIGRNCSDENVIELKRIAAILGVECHIAKFNYDGDYPIVLLDDEKDVSAKERTVHNI